MKKLLMMLALTGVIAVANAEKPSTESVEKLMRTTQSEQLAQQMFKQTMAMLKTRLTKAPEEFWQELEKESGAEGLVKLLIPVYQKNLSQEDVDAITAFYNTPAGKNLIAAQPKIMQESMMIGQQWGQEIAQKAIANYKAKYGDK